ATNGNEYSYDGNGNVRDIISASGLNVAHYEYDPFGNKTASSGSYSSQPYQWSSKEFHAPSGMVYYLYRFYNPVLGRWVNRDPIGERGGINLLAFVGNDPVSYIDPVGLINLLVTGSVHTQINDGTDALAHFRSGAGGTVPAGAGLVSLVKNTLIQNYHGDLKKAIEKQLRGLGRSVLCKATSGKISRAGGVIGVSVGDFALGNIDLHILAYDVDYAVSNGGLGFKKISYKADRPASFNETYQFVITPNPVTWVKDAVPGVIAGTGTNFQITGSFTDTVEGWFTLCCWGQ
ncbi:MAG: RHS repeat-associated core domain-containing protein, partial [Blastochloris sp.]|nr:RHS repeat-associated core domain-containing protein [Blastochloris sp.]